MLRRWTFPICILLLTCFGVFVLPFLLAPPPIAGVSAANAAGFNNRVAAVAAAVLSVVVLLKEFRWPSRNSSQERGEGGPVPLSFLLALAALCGALTATFGRLIVLSQERYLNDAGYFMEQIGSHAEFGRKLYDQIEFPYGPVLFYTPIFLRSILFPFHLSLAGAYFTTLVLEQIVGLLMVGYIINRLPMRRMWKFVTLVLCVPLTIELSFGLSHTFFRFALAPAFLVLAATRSKLWATCLCLFGGQVVSFSVSPEMGFAFAIAGTSYACIRVYTEGKRELVAVATPAIATVIFLIAASGSYLRMLKLFAHGLYNLIVEPLPHVLIFLFALVWLVPALLASSFRDRRPEAPMLASLYIFALVLLPVAFGRADPHHVLFNGLLILFLSIAGVGSWKKHLQLIWITCIAVVFLGTAYMDTVPFQWEFRAAIHDDVLHHAPQAMQQAVFRIARWVSPAAAERYFQAVYDADQPFDLAQLEVVTGGAKIATPLPVSVKVEVALKQQGQYVPSFYCFHVAMLDAVAEERKIEEVNALHWALIPKGLFRLGETPASTAAWLGFALPYRMKRRPYVAGECFDENLRLNWRAVAEVGAYQIYRRNDLLDTNADRLCFNS